MPTRRASWPPKLRACCELVSLPYLDRQPCCFAPDAQAQALTLAFRTRGIPVKLRTELDLLACAEVKDLLAYLRLAHSPADGPALARILNTPPRRLRSIELAFRNQPVPVDELPAWAIKRVGHASTRRR